MSWPEEPTIGIPPVRPKPDRNWGAYVSGIIGLVIFAAVVIWLIASGGDDDPKVATPPDKRSTTTSSTTTTTTTTTTIPITVPITVPPTLPPTTIPTPSVSFVTSVPPTTVAPTAPPTTGPTTTTTAPFPKQALADELEKALNGGVAPTPGTKPRVKVEYDKSRRKLSVTWRIKRSGNDTIPVVQAYDDAALQLRLITGNPNLIFDRVIIIGNYPIDDTDGDGVDDRREVIRMRFEHSTLNGIDFTTLDPLTLPSLADGKTIDPEFDPSHGTTTTSSTTSSTTTTT